MALSEKQKIALEKIKKKINETIKNRKKNLPKVEMQIDKWKIMKKNLQNLNVSIINLASNEAFPVQIKSQMNNYNLSAIIEKINNNVLKHLELLTAVQNRF